MRKYPRLYRQRTMPMRVTCLCWGIDCQAGWFHLLDDLSFKLTRIGEMYDIWVEATQVKEKYGTLRFYHGWQYGPSWIHPEQEAEPMRRLDPATLRAVDVSDADLDQIAKLIDTLVDEAEIESARTCEHCSMPGVLCGHGWLTTLCRNCAKKLDEYYPEPGDANEEESEEPKTEEAKKDEEATV